MRPTSSCSSSSMNSAFPPDGRFCEIFNLWVDPAYRRKGLATRLKLEMEAEARRRGIQMIYTHTEEANSHVIELNLKLGYHPIRTGPLWDAVPRVSLVKWLESPPEGHPQKGQHQEGNHAVL